MDRKRFDEIVAMTKPSREHRGHGYGAHREAVFDLLEHLKEAKAELDARLVGEIELMFEMPNAHGEKTVKVGDVITRGWITTENELIQVIKDKKLVPKPSDPPKQRGEAPLSAAERQRLEELEAMFASQQKPKPEGAPSALEMNRQGV